MDSEIAHVLGVLREGENVLLVGPDKTSIQEILEAVKLEKLFTVAQLLSAQEVVKLLSEPSDRVVLASLPHAHVLGATLALAKELQAYLGESSRLLERMLDSLVKSIRYVGTQKVSFREKLREAKYTGPKTRDHGQLLRGWTREGERCDPGWELDR